MIPRPRWLYLRSETNPFEYRTPIVPSDIPLLKSQGYTVVVESSPNRIYKDTEYSHNGAIVTQKKWWDPEFQTAYILGLKEIEDIDRIDGHTHVYFSHSYKEQVNAKFLLSTFAKKNGLLYDLEYFLDENKNRVLSFGFYAGIAGCYLALFQYHYKNQCKTNLPDLRSEALDTDFLAKIFQEGTPPLRVAIAGEKGNCGKGVSQVLESMNINYDSFGRTSDKSTLPSYDIVFNCIKLDPASTEVWFSETTEFQKPILIVDISCDPTRPNNPIAIYKEETTWENPVYSYNNMVDIIAISNLPSLLPKESSDYFSKKCVDLFVDTESEIWKRNESIYRSQIAQFF
jgi:saccharopine dehydrogenase (NAD+, L-lysine-forming)